MTLFHLLTGSHTRRWRIVACALMIALLATSWPARPGAAAPDDLIGPPGSGEFGAHVAVLPNGNVVVTDPLYDVPNGAADAGAAYLYDGNTRALISRLTGSAAGDRVGSGGIVPLVNGNYLIKSWQWDNGPQANVGAVTWADGARGITGTVSISNSLVGAAAGDGLGSGLGSIVPLRNGHYAVISWSWDQGAASEAGSVTWGDGTRGVAGVVSASNSLVGSHAGDRVGSGGLVELGNGHVLVRSPRWDLGGEQDAGAVTWFDGTQGIAGVVSADNSLIGNHAGDSEDTAITVLANGNYIVATPRWDNGSLQDAGAATWGRGDAGARGPISAAISLVGGSSGDQVGGGFVTRLVNGNAVVRSPKWNAGPVADVGAATWIDGTRGITGTVSSANSLVGSQTGDQVGFNVCALANGHYVVSAETWDNGPLANVGAFTWADGTRGLTGTVSISNSLVGVSPQDGVLLTRMTALANGHYVVEIPGWDNGAAVDAGAITWGDGTTGIRGSISITNSLVGSQPNDRVGFGGGVPLPNGHFVARSGFWANGSATKAGAITWIDGTRGLTGTVSVANSIVGTQADDRVSNAIPVIVGDSNYVVASPFWSNGALTSVGAVTWADGSRPITGTVSSANSLIGASPQDGVGGGGITPLANGGYVVASPGWDHGLTANVGAFTWGDGMHPLVGTVSPGNSLIGGTAGDAAWPARVQPFPNGAYLVLAPEWDHGSATNAGAITWGSGTTPLTGTIGSARSLVGTTSSDRIGATGEQHGGAFLSLGRGWDQAPLTDVGAVTLLSAEQPLAAPVSSANSAVGGMAGSGITAAVAADSASKRVAIGWRNENRVSLLTLPSARGRTFIPFLIR